MENEIKKKISSKYEFQTPKIINKNLSLRKTKSSGNISFKSTESSSFKTPCNIKTNKDNKYFSNKNAINHSNTLNNKKLINKVNETKNKISLKISKDNMYQKKNNTIETNKKNKEENKKELIENSIKKVKLSNSLNIIPLPSNKNTISPRLTNKIKEKINGVSPRLKNKPFLIENDKTKENSIKEIKNQNKSFRSNKETINKNILKGKNKLEIIPISKKNSRNNLNSARQYSRTRSMEFLYLPHIILDPLDVLKNQIEIVLQKYEDKIKNLNELHEKNIQTKIKSINEEYSNELYKLYQERGNELIQIKNNYNKEIYNLTYNNGTISEEELNNNKDTQIKEVEKKFKEKKVQLKMEFKIKIEEINNSFNINEQIDLNKKLILEMKNKFLKIFNDKNMINKKGINFSPRDYKNIIKESKNIDSKLRNSSFHKK